MKNKGFTLIELLAVIVILAIIALIAIPTILNIINDVKYNSLKRSAEFYIDGVEKAISKKYLSDKNITIKDGKYDIMSNGSICLETDNENKCINELDVEINGNVPSGGFLDIIDNKITYYDVKINDTYVSKKEHTPEECFEMSGSSITRFICAPMVYDLTEKKVVENTNSINNITDVVIPTEINGTKVTTIASTAFIENLITSVIIPNSVTTIGGYAFQSNNLTNIILPSNITTINNNTFYNNNLTNVILPAKLKTIGYYSFQKNKLTSIYIPDGTINIYSTAFMENKINYIHIPNSVTNIGVNAFRYNHLTSITIPSSVTTISSYAFYNNKLTSVIIKGKNSLEDFTSFGTQPVFGWASGYSNNNIIWEP